MKAPPHYRLAPSIPAQEEQEQTPAESGEVVQARVPPVPVRVASPGLAKASRPRDASTSTKY